LGVQQRGSGPDARQAEAPTPPVTQPTHRSIIL
jgi:hypothetical protein